jgi:hypothetical protein
MTFEPMFPTERFNYQTTDEFIDLELAVEFFPHHDNQVKALLQEFFTSNLKVIVLFATDMLEERLFPEDVKLQDRFRIYPEDFRLGPHFKTSIRGSYGWPGLGQLDQAMTCDTLVIVHHREQQWRTKGFELRHLTHGDEGKLVRMKHVRVIIN